MLIFNNNKPIKQKRWINTKVEFIWDGSQYVEQSAEGYWYDGEMALCTVTATGADSATALYIQNEANSFNYMSIRSDGVMFTHGGPNWRVYSCSGTDFFVNSGGDRESESFYRWYTKLDAGSDVEKMRLTAAGNLGIGSETPTELLEVKAGTEPRVLVHSTTGANVQTVLGSSSSQYGLVGTTANVPFTIITNDTEQMRIDATGNVGIGTTSPSYALEVTGTFYSGGSSIDYKKHVTDLDVDSSLIHSLRPVSYNYKKEYKDFGYNVKEGKQIGLVSEEVAETIPELAIMKDGRPKNVDYQKLAVVLLAEVQSLKKDIEELKKDN